MVTVASGFKANVQSDKEKQRVALSKAKELAKALDEAINAD